MSLPDSTPAAKALSLKNAQSQKKLKVTVTSKKLLKVLENDVKDSAQINKIASELEDCWFEFELAHMEYMDFVSSDDSLSDFLTVNNMNFGDYKSNVYDAYSNAFVKYQEFSTEAGKTARAQAQLRLRTLIKRLENMCEGAKAVYIDLKCDRSKLLSHIQSEIDPVVEKAYKIIGSSSTMDDCDSVTGSLDSIVQQIDNLKLGFSLSSAGHNAHEVKPSLDTDNVTNNATDSSTLNSTKIMTDCSTSHSYSTPPGLPLTYPYALNSTRPLTSLSHGLQTVSSGTVSAHIPHYADTVGLSSQGAMRPISPVVSSYGNLPSITASLPYQNAYPFQPSFTSSFGIAPPSAMSQSNAFSSQSSFTSSFGTVPTSAISQPITDTVPHRLSDVHIKRSSLPEFSGHRKDWPEFKAIWRELAERAFNSKAALAFELKKSLKGVAKDRVKNIYITRPEAYDLMWLSLSEYYDDCSASVQSALEVLHRLKPVRDEDFKGLVHLVDEVEAAYSQLNELGQTEILSMREIDRISDLLPNQTKMVWVRVYHQLDMNSKIRPLGAFMQFLANERASVIRFAERQGKKVHQSGSNFAASGDKFKSSNSKGKPNCVLHAENSKHKTVDCKEFEKLTLDEKFSVLRAFHACFKCFGYHRRDQCKSKVSCDTCKNSGHMTLMCKQEKSAQASSHTTRTFTNCSLYAIYQVPVEHSSKQATVFCDNGSTSSYITHRAAKRLGAKVLDQYTLDVTTMGNINTEYKTCLYELTLKTVNGRSVPVHVFGMQEITSSVSILNGDCLKKLFPDTDPSRIQRKSSRVDVLLGSDYFGLHPKHEVCRAGSDLSIMQGELGICLQGSHPELQEDTFLSSSMVRVLHTSSVHVECHLARVISHPEFDQSVFEVNKGASVVKSECLAILSEQKLKNFVEGEELATEVVPKCGGCRCSKCPTVGHTYSFKEQQELNLIRDNLKYDDQKKCWTTKYPWLADPGGLPDNYGTALATLKGTEVTLRKDSVWAAKYSEQITDMLDRNVARLLSEDELLTWKGPTYYISHLAVTNAHSQSTPVRIVFNSSQICHGVSLNSVLAKGPDAYLNNLLGLLLRWREGRVAVVGDIRKMFHSVHLEPVEQHCHRFLWRDLDASRKPNVFVMTRVNMGDRPAPAICTEALYMTADKFESDSPVAAEVIRRSTYVDDILDSFPDMTSAVQATKDVECMLGKGGFKIKCWQLSGHAEGPTVSQSLLKSDGQDTRVLGISWEPDTDVMKFKVTLNFSPKRKGERTGPNLQVSDLPAAIPVVLTRRLVLQQVMMLFDPLGLICPFTLLAKVYLRETWVLKLGWDDPLPENLQNKWLQFFTRLFDLESLGYQRSLYPLATPFSCSLIIFSDASDVAYGFAAYVRWEMDDGQISCRLIMAKSRIAPLRKLSTPQMELNAAVLSKRGRKVIEREMRFKFQTILHIVDSETVLNMINKTSTRFKVYEGVRVGEIQSATEGDMSSWAWLPGEHNSADLLSRGCFPKQLSADSEWWNGPPILYRPMEEWDLKFGLQRDDQLPGEKKLTLSFAADVEISPSLSDCIDYSRYSNARKLIRVVAMLLVAARTRSFNGVSDKVTPEFLREAEKVILADVQLNMVAELSKNNGGRYTPLKPVLGRNGLWVVGSRLQQFNPMCPESEAQVLLPTKHVVTRLLMRTTHEEGGHRGRDATLARFRQHYWTPYGSKLAWSTKNSCQLCKLRDPQLLCQEMGILPDSRLKPAPAFTNVMLDLFGPYKVRGEVNKRISGKAYGVIFTDMVMRAVHIEVVLGYDSNSFLMALSRFASIRGWPENIYSDPGSQLVGVERELREAWKKLDQSVLIKKGAEKGLTWHFGPADGPWYQGAVESLVKSAKKSIDFAVHNQRLTPMEFLTLCVEVANLLNERPIGTLPSSDAEISILTPNCLLIGRATSKNPGGWQPRHSHPNVRYRLFQDLIDSFWKRWTELCAPALVVQRKWHTSSRNLKSGDVVIVTDRNMLRGDYKLGLVKEVFKGRDGKVRRVTLMYKNFKIDGKLHKATEIVVSRPVQRLALLVPVDDNESQLI